MKILLLSLAGLVLAITLWDAFITVFSSNGAGPLSRWWGRGVWNTLLAVHRRWRMHRALSVVGPGILVLNILLWYVLIGVALLLAVAAVPDSVVNSTTRAPVDLSKKIHFVTTTISSLGYGDLVPSGFPWTMLSTTGTLLATVIVTTSLSYVLAVLGAAVERRSLANSVFSMGVEVPDVVETAQLHDPMQSLKPYLLDLAGKIDQQAFKHLAYPVLKFFHTADATDSPARAVLLLGDALFVLGNLPPGRRPPAGVLKVLESSIANYARTARAGMMHPPEPRQAPEHLLAAASRLGACRDAPDALHAQLEAYLPTRSLLVAVCREDGWFEH
jgi:hypothetical protein